MGLRRIINGIEGLQAVLFPVKSSSFYSTSYIIVNISTRNFNTVVFWGDGTFRSFIPNKNWDYIANGMYHSVL